MNVTELSDEELYSTIDQLHREKNHRVERARLEEKEKKKAYFAKLKTELTDTLIDAIAPEHNPGRYTKECTDDDQEGYWRTQADPKEFGCQRCNLFFIRTADLDCLYNQNFSIDFGVL